MTSKNFTPYIKAALKEDRASSDITSLTCVAKSHTTRARIIAKEDGILCGLEIAKATFRQLNKSIQIKAKIKEGNPFKKGNTILEIKGETRAILTTERTALNFLGHLSGIATLTNTFVKTVKPFKAQILDTRKTTPTMRELEKYAVKTGGGTNHRMNLSEMAMIKDNHRHLMNEGDYKDFIKIIRTKYRKPVTIEVDTLKQFNKVLKTLPDIILLDNMPPAQLRQAVKVVKKTKSKVLLEASGGITLKNVRSIAKTGVKRISIGALTHSVPSINFSLEFV